ncbi:hypothetical protein HPB51_007683 [Rhipicephalus microplus]|uniref:Uncharacterized protein n=1 Tax=Rhipicephalus microplus TaxID=6941 RepID=A0A9J6DTD3_RHIMP|nr:hypothetical protein HPB51_007683 [Rhipicephalus microplus]
MDASSSVESGLGTSGGASCSVPTSELVNRPTGERAPAPSSRPRSRFPITEAVVTTQRYTLGCVLVSTLIVIVLFAITGAVWYRYVARPGIITAQTTRDGEREPRVLVIVVQATDPKRSLAVTTPRHATVGHRGHVRRSSAGAVSLTEQVTTGTPTEMQTSLEEENATEKV